MEYYVKSVVPIIESNYDKFTTVERNIADFFIQNRKKVDFSSKSISERLFESEASLSRFAKKCGYRGYREFIYQYEETFVEKQESITGNTRMILNAYQELLNKTYSLVDEAQIARISRYLNQAGWLRAVLHRSCSDSITQTPESWECNLTAVPDFGHA